MNAVKKIPVLVAIIVAALACESKKDTQQQAAKLYEESMKIHDEVMPRINELFTLRQKLTLRLDSLEADSITNALDINHIRSSIADLEVAHKGMMDWMHNVQAAPGVESEHGHHSGEPPAKETKVNADDQVKNQENQKLAIEKVKTDIEKSITRAKELL